MIKNKYYKQLSLPFFKEETKKENNYFIKFIDLFSGIGGIRRGFEFYHQYVLKDKEVKKNIVWIELSNNIKRLISQSLEELGINYCYSILFDLYSYLKNSKCRYRVPLQLEESFRQNSLKYQLVL